MREEPTIEWTCRFSFRHRTSEPITVVGSSDAVLCKTPLVRLGQILISFSEIFAGAL